MKRTIQLMLTEADKDDPTALKGLLDFLLFETNYSLKRYYNIAFRFFRIPQRVVNNIIERLVF